MQQHNIGKIFYNRIILKGFLALVIPALLLIVSNCHAQTTWTGTWDTSWSGGGARMHLTQNGNRVTGTFEYKGGTIDGTISGNRLTGRWTQTNGSGTIDFIMSAGR